MQQRKRNLPLGGHGAYIPQAAGLVGRGFGFAANHLPLS